MFTPHDASPPEDGKLKRGGFTARDKARLDEAMALIKDVADQHPSGDLRVISFLCSALQDVRMAELVDGNGNNNEERVA